MSSRNRCSFWRTWIGGLAVLAVAVQGQGSPLRAALQIRIEAGFHAVPAAAARPQVLINDLAMPGPGNGIAPQESDRFRLGAALKTDPDLESILEKAARYQADGNWDVASQLWQAVLERSNDTLVTSDGANYRSMMEQVERILVSLPPEGLAVYRISADANARALLAGTSDPYDPLVLGAVVQRYFPSTVGADAACRLAGVLIDRHEFVGAQRLLEKALYLHPNPPADRSELVGRLALCYALSGNRELVQGLVESEPAAMAAPSGRAVLALMDRIAAGDSGDWRDLVGGTQAEFRSQPALPAGWLGGDLLAGWQFAVDPQATYNDEDVRGREMRAPAGAPANFALANITSPEQSFHRTWWANRWRPSGQLLTDGERVFFRSPANLIAWSAGGGEKRIWASAWLNRYELDAQTQNVQALRANMGGNGMGRGGRRRGSSKPPDNETTVQLFGDRIHASMTLADGRLYVLEGAPYDRRADRGGRGNNRGNGLNTSANRSRTNWLTVYEASTGRALWQVPANAGNRDVRPAVDPAVNAGEGVPVLPEGAAVDRLALDSGGFMGPPVVFGEMVYIAHSQGGAIHVYGLDGSRAGKVVWKTYLCDEPESGAPPWAPIVITLEGSDLFVGSGMGVVFCLDRATGGVRFARRYERAGRANREFQAFGFAQNQYDFTGFCEDLILPWGREMICFLSDSDTVFSIDRRTGELVWQADIAPLGEAVDYVLGIRDRVLYAAGRRTIVAFDLDGHGRMLWGGEPLFGDEVSFGMGYLAEDGIHIPVRDEIWRFALHPPLSTPRPEARATVNLGMEAPVGNLTSDGARIWVHNGNRIFRLDRIEKASLDEPPAARAGDESPEPLR